MFRVVESPQKPIWVPVDYASTLYVGELVVMGFNASVQGAYPYVVAGLGDITGDKGIFGVVIGTNNRTPLYSATYKTDYISGVATQALQLAREWQGQEGMWSKADPAAMVQVAIVSSETVLEGDIFKATVGIAPDVVTNTVASTDGSTITTVAMTYATVAYNNIWYCRSGSNMGLYRIGYAASTTASTFYLTWPYDIAVGDTFCMVPLTIGQSKADFDALGLFIDSNMDTNQYGTDHIWLDVLSVDLRYAGKETAKFRINPYCFNAKRA